MSSSHCHYQGQVLALKQQQSWVGWAVSIDCKSRSRRRTHVNRHHAIRFSIQATALSEPSYAVEQTLLPGLKYTSSASTGTDTITAIVTGAQQGSVAIIRLSGPEAVLIASAVFKPSHRRSSWAPKTHRIYHGHVLDADGSILDEVLLLSMLAPRSYTSEDVVELQCHGGGLCAQRVLACCLTAGARLAKPGEFTLRAFLNGRLDLSQAESVNELVGARTAAAADSAIAGLTGGIGALVQGLRRSALLLLAELEAMIDFEEDVPDNDAYRLQQTVQQIAQGVQQALDTASKGRLLKAGLQVALVGRPNVGKSSLLNAWSGTDKAIVTQVAGTTRDIVQADVVVGGIPVSLLDTAGMREASDVVERLGVERSQAAAVQADVAIMVLDAQAGWTADDQTIFEQLWGRAVPGSSPAISAPSLLVWNKVDLAASNGSSVLPLQPQTESTHGSTAPAAASNHALIAADGNSDMQQQHSRGLQQYSPHEEDRCASSTHAADSNLEAQTSLPAKQTNKPLQQGSSTQACEHTQRQNPLLESDSDSPQSTGAPPPSTISTNDSTDRTHPGTQGSARDGAASIVSTSLQVSKGLNDHTATRDAAISHQPERMPSDEMSQAASFGIPSTCAGCFAAVVDTCATSGLGLDALGAALLQLANAPYLAAGGVGWAINNRQAEALIRAQAALADVTHSINHELPIDFWTIDLRAAVSALGEVSGDDVTEEVLDSVFSQFCIGK